jgi:hypothetical protein
MPCHGFTAEAELTQEIGRGTVLPAARKPSRNDAEHVESSQGSSLGEFGAVYSRPIAGEDRVDFNVLLVKMVYRF